MIKKLIRVDLFEYSLQNQLIGKKIYILKYGGNKGSTPSATKVATKVPKVIKSVDSVEPSEILDGKYARPHSGAWICRNLNKPKIDLAESKICVKDTTSNQVRNIRLDYKDGWRVNYKEGPRKRSIVGNKKTIRKRH